MQIDLVSVRTHRLQCRLFTLVARVGEITWNNTTCSWSWTENPSGTNWIAWESGFQRFSKYDGVQQWRWSWTITDADSGRTQSKNQNIVAYIFFLDARATDGITETITTGSCRSVQWATSKNRSSCSLRDRNGSGLLSEASSVSFSVHPESRSPLLFSLIKWISKKTAW